MTDDAASTTADMLKVFNDMPPSFFEGVSQALSSPVSSSSNPEDASSSPPLAPPCPSPTTNKDINTDASTNQPSPAHPTVAPAHDMENQARDEFDAAAEVIHYDAQRELVAEWEALQVETATHVRAFSEQVLSDAFKLVHDFSRAMYQKTEETRIQLEETVKAIQTEEGKQERAVKRMRSYLRLRAEARDQLASSDEE
ncbi:uncharacterized protein EHS24_003488 [Apiotrichum porosum]|uniref:Uncharacterized protein n=1 Tax=Apiotrichum porosum TaxID=105984 RepID=A0A427XEC2_9TREE|nr:uncharacterized protein EHS24_003488 [Apiotrichum porosum]RSH77188.1 hypothetical protein EHS24_003488 [Apiotrichum porosum]